MAGDNKYTLNCLVQGDPAQCAFPVHLDRNSLVGDLKELIKSKKRNFFRTIDADMLILWKVSIPDDDNANDAIEQLAFENDKLNGTKDLRPTWKIQDYFDKEPMERHIHIIVGRRSAPGKYQASLYADYSCLQYFLFPLFFSLFLFNFNFIFYFFFVCFPFFVSSRPCGRKGSESVAGSFFRRFFRLFGVRIL